MSTSFEVGGPEEDMYTNMWDDVDWGFDGLDDGDWYETRIPRAREKTAEGEELERALWDALRDENVANQPDTNEPSSSATFHTVSSHPPRLPPESPRRLPSSSRVNETTLTQQSRRPMGANSSTPVSSRTLPIPVSRPRHSQPGSIPRRTRLPTPAHREDWLDPTATRPSNSFGYLTENLFTPTDAISPSFGSDDFPDAIDIDDILTDGDSSLDAENMAPRTRRQGNANSFVDLTNDPSPPASSPPRQRQPRSLKRSAEDSLSRQSDKRRKGTTKSVQAEDEHDIEQLDLTNEAPSAEEVLAQAQTAAAVFAQQAPNFTSGPLKIGQRQCIICMENFTNITITACGHIYCHECLTQALLAGEKNSESGKANCPVCRKPVNRKKATQVIPLSFMKKSTFKGKARREMPVLG